MNTKWKSTETEHYIFHYKAGSLAERELDEITTSQESCFMEITATIKIELPVKIQYYLCNTRQEVMQESGFEYEINGIALCNPDNPKIYAIYTEDNRCIGFHEDTHAIACHLAFPESIAIIEGLAMHFDKVWWKIPNELCVHIYQKDNKYESVEHLIRDNQYFCQISDSISYPIMGAFTTYLIEQYGIDKYKLLYQYSEDVNHAFQETYGINLSELEQDFIITIQETSYSNEQCENARQELYT